jgi:hypothetical protein
MQQQRTGCLSVLARCLRGAEHRVEELAHRDNDAFLRHLRGQSMVVLGLLDGSRTCVGRMVGFDRRVIFLEDEMGVVAYMRHAVSWIMAPGGTTYPTEGDQLPAFGGLKQFLDSLDGTIECYPGCTRNPAQRVIGSILSFDDGTIRIRPDREEVTRDTVQWVFIDSLSSIGRYRPLPMEPGAPIQQTGPELTH